MTNWMEIDFTEAIEKISTNEKKLKQKDYLSEGNFPVIDQGQAFIGGYTNDASRLIKGQGSVIVFGDHTRIVKLVPFDFVPGADGVKVIKPRAFYNPKLFSFFMSVLAQMIPNKGYARHFQHLEVTKIPFPSYKEQEHIVEKIEELFSDLDNAIENLKKAQGQLKVYQLSVLKEAYCGGLTADWRKEHKDAVEGKKVLADIIRQIKQPALDLEDVTKIPDQWTYTSIVNLVAREKDSLKRGPFGSAIKKSFFVPDGFKVYEQQNAIKNDCALGTYYIDRDKYEELKNFAVRPGDFIVSCAGTIGCIAEVSESAKPGVINQALLKVKVNADILDKKFFLYQFNLYVERFMRSKSRGSAMKNMSSVKELKQVPFVFTSISEQRQVVLEIESRFSVCDKLEETIESGLKQAESLRQSILKQAFEGKLTEQWRKEHKDLISGENSAESLLKKIKAEKEALQVKPKGKKRHD